MRNVSVLCGLLLLSSIGFVGTTRAAPPVAPMLINPGFEADGTGVASPVGWTSRGDVNASFTEWGGHSGNLRLSHWSPNPYSVDTFQTLNDVPEGWYTIRAWARRSTGNNNTYIALKCGRDVERTYAPAAWPGQWVQIAASVRARSRSCDVVIHTDADGGEWANFDDVEIVPGAAKLSVVGADVSSLNKSVAMGGVYFNDDDDWDHARGGHERHEHDDREIASTLAILREHGVEYIRLRAWVNPADGYHDRREVLKVSRLAHDVGLKVLVDFHYSDTWADPGHQAKPAAWANYTVPQLAQAVYDYTFSVCSGMKAQGTPPAIVQIGNELNSGMLFPDGSTWNPPNWNNLAAFLNAGASAVKACDPETKVMLHLANGGDNGTFRWWFDNITALGVPFDVIGASYYGYWDGSLGDLQANLDDVSARYGKDVVVVETAYPFTLDDADGFPNQIGLPSQLVAGYPATQAGQTANLRDVLSIVRAVPNGRGLGVFYWDATWTAVPGNGWDPTDPTSGDNWENQALFDFNDRALPAMSELHR
jgi:arabinogalactan endo-1,4-beta-galactosidase